MCQTMLHTQCAFWSQAHEKWGITQLSPNLQIQGQAYMDIGGRVSNMTQLRWCCFLGWSLFHFLYVMFWWWIAVCITWITSVILIESNNRSRIDATCTIQEQCFFICSGILKKPLLCMSRWQKSTHTHQSDRTPMCQLPRECFSPGPTHRRLSEDSQLFIIIPNSFSPRQLSVSNISCCPWNHQTDIWLNNRGPRS